MELKYINPYTGIGTKYTAGLDAVVAVIEPLYPNQTIDDVVNSIYTYVTTAYSMTPEPIEEQNIKSLINSTINGYLNYQLFYNQQQTYFINKLIGGTLICGNPEDIKQHIQNVEEEIISSGMSTLEQMPLLYATAIGKVAYTYWANVITTPGSWVNFITSFTPAIVKFPYWVATSMQGTLIGLNTLNSLQDSQFANAIQLLLAANGAEILLSLFGSLAVSTGKVVFNLQSRKIEKPTVINTRVINTGGGDGSNGIIIAFKWGNYEGNGRGCSLSWGLCYIEIFLAPPLSSPGVAKFVDGKVNVAIDASNIPAQFRDQLITGVIPVSQDIELTQPLCKALGVQSYTIKSGNYQFTNCCGAYHFVF